MKKFFRYFVSKIYTLSRVYGELTRIKYFIKKKKINLIFDIGSNTGQYAKSLRRYGYKNRIISIEPLEREYKILNIHFKNDKKFKSYNYAIGSENKITNINVAENSVSSSLYKPTKLHLNISKKINLIDKEKIELIQLDRLIKLKKIHISKSIIMIKIDAQGNEIEILKGAKNILQSARLIQLEVSFQKLYSKNKNYLEILNFLDKYNFKIIDFFYGVRSKKNHELLQADIIFAKKT